MLSRYFYLTALSALSTSSLVSAWPTPGNNFNPMGNNWAGVNSYFLQAFQEPNRTEVLDAIQNAHLRTLRIFISYTPANNKGTGSVGMPDIEPVKVGEFDDTQLLAIDQLMVEAQQRNIKLIITMHDRYQLGCWGDDSYVTKLHLPAVNCNYSPASENNVTSFYTNPVAIQDFDNRLRYILEHRNQLIHGEPQWKDLGQYIFAFDIENEAEGHLNNDIAPVPEWWCDRSKLMRSIMGNSKVLIATGGGNAFSNSDIPQNWACETLNLVDIHSYASLQTFEGSLQTALGHALAANKLMLLEEFGSLGATKAADISQYINLFNQMGVPWQPWEISKPGMGASNYEFYTTEATYYVVQNGALEASQLQAAQNFYNLK